MRAFAIFAVLVLWCVMDDSTAQQFPDRPLRLVIGATGAGDVLARVIGTGLSTGLGHPVVVDNRPGANQLIAAQIVSKATPDGHTLLAFSAGFTINPSVYSKLPFDSVRDFSFVAQTVAGMGIMVINLSLPVRTLPDLIAYVRSNPGKVLHGSSGVGSPGHLAVELFKLKTKTDLLHVPYKGMAAAMTDLMAGRVQLIITTIPSALEHVKRGRMRALAVTGAYRSPAAPELPTIIEAGLPGYTFTNWYGIAAPAGTPRPVIARLNAMIVAATDKIHFRQQISALGVEVATNTPEEFTVMIKEEIEKWAKVVTFAGIKVD